VGVADRQSGTRTPAEQSSQDALRAPESAQGRRPGAIAPDAPFRDSVFARRPSWFSRLNARLERHFVDREIFVRGNDRVRYLRISARVQKVAAVATVALLTWTAIATTGIGLQQTRLALQDEQIANQQTAYLDLMEEVTAYHAAFSQITADLEANQTYLLEILQQDGIAPDKLAGIEQRLNPTDDAEGHVALARESLRKRLERFETELHNIAQRNETLQGQVAALRATLHASQAEREAIATARTELEFRLMTTEAQLRDTRTANGELAQVVAGLRAAMGEREATIADLGQLRDLLKADIGRLHDEAADARAREAALKRQLAETRVRLREAVARGDGMLSERNRMAAQVVAAFGQMGELREAQQELLARLDDRTASSVEALEQALAMTGVDFGDVLEAVEAEIRVARVGGIEGLGSSVGGPYLPVGLAGPPDPHADRLELTYSLLDRRIDRWDAVKKLFEAVPVAAPMREFRLTSNFGTRKDPITGKNARHEGLDLVGAWREPILATAPGVVTFAGWKGAYGRMVEVDHGYGFKTRYAHLRSMDVEVGDVVDFGRQIGEMGNSGRSTGAHLHYEILFEDKPYDPANFLKAGRHVFKG
jgi:murein DD-endopeptidase MepM/ murein hydrolase activator NlpD